MKLLSLSLILGLLLAAFSPEVVFSQGRGGRGGSSFGGNGGSNRNGGGQGQSGGMNRSNVNEGRNNTNPAVPSQENSGSRNLANNRNGSSQAHSSYYRGENLNNRSVFFGNQGFFNNAFIGTGNFNTYGNYGRGFGYGGYGGFGGYGLGYGGNGGYGFLPFLGGLGLGYGIGGGLGYGGYGGNGAGFGSYGAGSNTPTTTPGGNQIVAAETQPPAETPANPPTSIGTNYVLLGESDFRAAKYQEAIGAFRHALLDEPNNAGLMLMVAQALFQTGRWTEAAATDLRWGHSQRTNGAQWCKTIRSFTATSRITRVNSKLSKRP